MKINDIVNEGATGDWISRKFGGVVPGMDKEKSFANYQTHKQNQAMAGVKRSFVDSFKQAFDSYVASGQINLTPLTDQTQTQTQAQSSAEEIRKKKLARAGAAARDEMDIKESPFDDYQAINRVIENLVADNNFLLKEQTAASESDTMTPAEFAERYMLTKMGKFNLDAVNRAAIKKIAQEFGSVATSTKQFPVDIGNKFFDTYRGISQMQQRDNYGNFIKSPTTASSASATVPSSTKQGEVSDIIDDSIENEEKLVGEIQKSISKLSREVTVKNISDAMIYLGLLFAMKDKDQTANYLGAGGLYDAVIKMVQQHRQR